MEFTNAFDVPLPPAQAWRILMDIERIAPCLPGAELTEVVDATTYKGKISVKLGPVALTFAGVVKLEDIDEINHAATIRAHGTDAKGRGGAQGLSTFRIVPTAGGSTVEVRTDLTLSGAVAQYGRATGIIQATAAQLIKRFSDCLRAEWARAPQDVLTAEKAEASAHAGASPPAAERKPISGLSLLVKVIVGKVRDLVAKRFGRSSSSS